MQKEEVTNLYKSKTDQLNVYVNDLEKIVAATGEPFEGNSFYHHLSLVKYPELFYKQVNLFWSGMQATKRICEIGFNAGHSTLLMLLGRDKSKIDYTVFDIGEHGYTKPAAFYMETKFPHVNFEFIYGDSTVTMPQWINEHKDLCGEFDVVHIDGGHSEHCISNDFSNSAKLVKKGGLVIIDDTNFPHINKYVNIFLATGLFTEMDVIHTPAYPHRILRRNM